MTLQEIFEKEKLKSTPVQEFIARISKITGKTSATVYRWINGSVEPDKANRELLAKHFKTTSEELFRYLDKK